MGMLVPKCDFHRDCWTASTAGPAVGRAGRRRGSTAVLPADFHLEPRGIVRVGQPNARQPAGRGRTDVGDHDQHGPTVGEDDHRRQPNLAVLDDPFKCRGGQSI